MLSPRTLTHLHPVVVASIDLHADEKAEKHLKLSRDIGRAGAPRRATFCIWYSQIPLGAGRAGGSVQPATIWEGAHGGGGAALPNSQ